MIKEGNTVKIHYTGKFEDNNIFDTSENKEPLEFVVGSGKLIPGFENGIVGLDIGDKKTIELEVSEAYGEIKKELINDVAIDRLPKDVQAGQVLQANTAQGPINVTVMSINETTATINANHPLAGKKLIFDLEVLEVL